MKVTDKRRFKSIHVSKHTVSNTQIQYQVFVKDNNTTMIGTIKYVIEFGMPVFKPENWILSVDILSELVEACNQIKLKDGEE